MHRLQLFNYKLNGDNYYHWKFQMKMNLIGKVLWDIVTGTETLPTGTNAEQQRKFKKRENTALATICLSLIPSLQIYVRSANNAKEAWENLAGHFEKKSLSQKILYRRKLYAARMEKGTKMLDHINYIKTLAEHMEGVGDAVSENDLVIILISSLPEEYNFLITALETIKEEMLTWDYVRDRLLHEYDKMQRGSSGSQGIIKDDEDALRSRKYAADQKRFKCHYCKMPGHFAKNCYKKKADAKKRQKDKEESARISVMVENEVSVDEYEVALAVNDNTSECKKWWIDSGASMHVTPKEHELDNYTALKNPLRIRLADDSTLLAYGKGSCRVTVYDGKVNGSLLLNDFLFVPKLQSKLLSLPTMTEKGLALQFKGQFCHLMIDDKKYCIGKKYRKLYSLNSGPAEDECLMSKVNDGDAMKLWHYRYGHLGYDNLKLLSDTPIAEVADFNTREEFSRDCEGCAKGKMHRLPFPKKSQHQSNEVIGIIHTDVCGPMHVTSMGGSKHFVTFIDDYTRFTTIYFLKNKSQVLEKFKEFVASTEKQTGKKVKILRSDNGGEYKSEEFAGFCKSHGIKQEWTVPMNPEQNGVSERMNRTIMETARSMLYHGKLQLGFWAEAVSTAVYLRNHTNVGMELSQMLITSESLVAMRMFIFQVRNVRNWIASLQLVFSLV